MLTEDLIGVPDAAKLLGIAPESLYEAIHAGRIPARTILRRYALRREDIEAYRQRTQPHGKPQRGRPRKEKPPEQLGLFAQTAQRRRQEDGH